MKKIILSIILFSLTLLNATPSIVAGYRQATLEVNKPITMYILDTLKDPKDWIGIYKKGDSNEWKNVVSWTYIDKDKIPFIELTVPRVGEYEARLFFKDSYNLEAKSSFTVNNELQFSVVKNLYRANETVQLKFSGMLGDAKDWIGIYKQGDSNAWENVVAWKWTDGVKESESFNIATVPVGDYEARAFFKNSFKVEARSHFKVSNVNVPSAHLHVGDYTNNRNIKVTFRNFSGDSKDWIAIYKKGDSSAWENVVAWKWIEGRIEGDLRFNKLPVGNYEARGFFRNSFDLETKSEFRVINYDLNKNALIAKAKEHCQGQDNSTSNVLCSEEPNVIYILDSTDENGYKIKGSYKIIIKAGAESVETLFEYPQAIWQHPHTGYGFINKLQNTLLYGYASGTEEADERGIFYFLHKGKIVLSFFYLEDQGSLRNIHTFDNGNKLSLEYHYTWDDALEGNYKEIYNISNPANPILISKVKTPL